MLIRWFLALALTFTCLCSFAPPAAAQDDLARAVELITQANGDYDAGNFKSALGKYREAYEISEDPRVLYRIGLTYENLANYQRAREHLELYLLAEPDSQYAGRVKSKVENLRRLEATLQSTVRVVSNPPGARVWVDDDTGKPAGVTPVRIPVGPGSHELILKRDGFETMRHAIDVEAGKTFEATVDLEAGGPAIVAEADPEEGLQTAPGEPTDTTSTPEDNAPPVFTGEPTRVRIGPSTGLSVVSWIAIGLGWGILAFAGTVTGAGVNTSTELTTSGFLVGAGLIAAGAYFLWIRDYTSELPNRQVTAPSQAAPPFRAVGVGFSF